MKLETRFWSKVDKSGDCWLWTAFKNPKGYGFFMLNGKTALAHRVSFELSREVIPKGLNVLHHCDNPSCVNPSHLFLGTNADNVADKTAKGRAAFKEGHGMAKLSIQQIKDIRDLYQNGADRKVLGEQFNVNTSQITRIVNRTCWAHI